MLYSIKSCYIPLNISNKNSIASRALLSVCYFKYSELPEKHLQHKALKWRCNESVGSRLAKRLDFHSSFFFFRLGHMRNMLRLAPFHQVLASKYWPFCIFCNILKPESFPMRGTVVTLTTLVQSTTGQLVNTGVTWCYAKGDLCCNRFLPIWTTYRSKSSM